MLPVGNMEMVIFLYNFYTHGCNVFIHARTFCTLAHTTSIQVSVMYLHARMFCTLAHTTSIPVGAMYLHARTLCTLSDTILFPFRAPIFTVITKVWPCANCSVVVEARLA